MSQRPIKKTALFASRLIAGAGISLSPAGGTGQVTVTATGTQDVTTTGAVVGNDADLGVTGKAAASGSNANGGDVTLGGGAKDGTGVAGVLRENGVVLRQQGAQATQDTAATLTAAQLLAGILQSSPSGAINLTLPLQTAMDTALPSSVAGDSFDFSIINTSGGANTVTVVANSWTTVGVLTIAQNVSGRFRARKTGTGAWTLYRLA